jgi:hypothetical protein
MMTMFADRQGRMVNDLRLQRYNIFPFDDNISTVAFGHIIDELTSAGLLIQYESDGNNYIQIVNFRLNQKPSRQEIASTIPAPEGYIDPHDDLSEKIAQPFIDCVKNLTVGEEDMLWLLDNIDQVYAEFRSYNKGSATLLMWAGWCKKRLELNKGNLYERKLQKSTNTVRTKSNAQDESRARAFAFNKSIGSSSENIIKFDREQK